MITRFMPQSDYDRLSKKYSHDIVFKAFSDGAAASMGMTWRQGRALALIKFVHRWRVRLERLLSWLEKGKDGHSS